VTLPAAFPPQITPPPLASPNLAGILDTALPPASPAPSTFSQLVSEFVADSAPAPVPTLVLPAPVLPAPALPAPILPAPILPAPNISPLPLGTHRSDTKNSPVPAKDKSQPPAVPIEVTVPITVPVKPLALVSTDNGGSDPQSAVPAPVSKADPPPLLTLQAPPILEVNIHLNQPDIPAPPVAPPQPPALREPVAINIDSDQPPIPPSDTKLPWTKVSPPTAEHRPAAAPVQSNASTNDTGTGAQQQTPQRENATPVAVDKSAREPASPHSHPTGSQPAQPQPIVSPAQPAHTTPSAPVSVQPVPEPALPLTREARPNPPAPATPVREEPPTVAGKSQVPMRSLSLEFTPDGARDIKVRLSEKGGDVHISLHGTDPALAGRLREGVGDLVGSLSKAGYDAEAWTPGRERQNQQRQAEPPKAPRSKSGRAGAQDFRGIFEPAIQEIV
jgi:hypothetical protein